MEREKTFKCSLNCSNPRVDCTNKDNPHCAFINAVVWTRKFQEEGIIVAYIENEEENCILRQTGTHTGRCGKKITLRWKEE